MTSERLLQLLADHLAQAIQPELERYEAGLRAEATPKLAGMRPLEKASMERKIQGHCEKFALELCLAHLRQGPAAPDPIPEDEVARGFPALPAA